MVSSLRSCRVWPGPGELAGDLGVSLQQRGWPGDGELADQLDAQLGGAPASILGAVPVDLEELAGIPEGDPVIAGGRVELASGEVWPRAAIDHAVEVGEQGRGQRR